MAGTPLDPFHNDGKVNEFLSVLLGRLTDPGN